MKQTLGMLTLVLVGWLAASAAGAACPTDATPRAATVLLTVAVPGQPLLSLGAAELAALPQTRLTQKLSVSSSASAAAAV